MEENIIKGEVTDITYFGLKVYDEKFVRDEDIKQLPFYDFWAESAQNSTCLMHGEQRLIYLHDWERFCKLFIKTGKHRFQF